MFGPDHPSTHLKFEGLFTCPKEAISSGASLSSFIGSMEQEAAHEYADSAADPAWKVLSSPDYPGRVDAKEWIEKRKLRHPNSYSPVSQTNSSYICVSVMFIGFISFEIVFTTTAPSSSDATSVSLGSPYSSSFYPSLPPFCLTASASVATWRWYA